MTSPEPVDADGSLPESRKRLEDAVSGLVDPQPELAGSPLCPDCHNEDCPKTCEVHNCVGHTTWTDSLYLRLSGAVPGGQGQGHGIACSSPPLNIDATELKQEIDVAVAAWEPRPLLDLAQGDPPPMTVVRLEALEKRRWRPQDTRSMDQISGNIEAWNESIKALLNPTPRWHLPNPCPACDKTVVYRKNSAGEPVRQPALQLTADGGCECASCHYVWAPYRIQILAAALGYPLPEGVLN